MRRKVRIGELLIENGILSREQVDTALAEQKKRGLKLGQTFVELGYLSEDALLSFLARQLRIPFVDLRRYSVQPDTVQRLRETHARRFRAILLEDRGTHWLVGMADPTDLYAQDELERILERPVNTAIVRESDLLQTIDRIYRKTEEIHLFAEELHEELTAHDYDLGDLGVGDDAADAPVAKLLQSVFEDAVQTKASDIHIEPDERVLRIRLRVDGVLQEQVVEGARIASALVLKLKLMSGLDISEKRLPQDGRFHLKVRGKSMDVRLSTMPIVNGESVVMRLLDQAGVGLDLDQIGMPAALLERFRRLVHRPHGLLLVTGPTGSGKTTTLYAALRELNGADKKIITVEDPVEYRVPRLNQVQVNPKIELTFARVLRSALRQDPDIVMVGEMRDQETVEIGLRAALTGHLVLSTLHTNDAITSAVRLSDMGAAGYLAAAALCGVVAQRLMRRVCEGCKEAAPPSASQRAWISEVGGGAFCDAAYHAGRGCSQCNGTGYSGRMGVYELLEVDAGVADSLRRGDHAEYGRLARAQAGFEPLSRAALALAARCATTVSEAIRVSEVGVVEAVAMSVFAYTGRNREGGLVESEIDGDSVVTVATQLEDAGITPIRIAPIRRELDPLRIVRANWELGRIGPEDLETFCRQLHRLLRAGVPILRSITGLAETAINPAFGRALRDVADSLRAGRELSDALKRHPRIFSNLFASIVNVGEQTGRLDDALLQLASYLELERTTRKQINAATRYPMLVVVAIGGALVVLNLFVIPSFAKVFASFGAELPWATQLLLASSNFAVAYWPHLLAAALVVAVGVRMALSSERGRDLTDLAILRVPVMGAIVTKITLARYARSFAMSIEAGLPMLQTLQIVSRAVGNRWVGDRILALRSRIERGEGLTRAASACGLFTPLVLQMMAVAEESGAIGEMHREIAESYESEISYELRRFVDLLEPLLIVGIGGVVLVLALGIYLPMWDLSRAAHGAG